MKIAFFIIGTLLCIVLGLVPEFALYALWHVLAPTTEVMRVVTGLGFLFIGGGACIAFGFLAVAIWFALLKAVLE